MPTRLAREGIWDILDREDCVQNLPQISLKTLRQRLGAGIVLHHRKAASADAVLQFLKPQSVLWRGGDIVSALLMRIGWITEVEKRTSCHLRVVQNPVQDLKFGNTLAAPVSLEPGLALNQIRGIAVMRRDPAIPIPQHAYKIGARPVDLSKTDRKNITALGLLDCDPPT
ncbi:MAG: hypothetical protein JW395_2831 [Nitrospira sp.]|nr:hypothetical protein [Nitrospira sp.]